MNGEDVSTVLGIFTAAYVLSLLLTLFGLFSRKSRKIGLHAANVPLHIVHGIVSILLYSDLRKHAGRVGHPPSSSNLFTGAGIRGCAVSTWPSCQLALESDGIVQGIILPAWYLLAWSISGIAPHSFYLIPVNLLFVACFIVSAVLTNTSLPLVLDQCNNLQPEVAQIFAFVRQARGGKDEVDGCRQVFLIQTFTIVIMLDVLLLGFSRVSAANLPAP